MYSKKSLSVLILLTALVSLAALLSAGNTATIKGQVTDAVTGQVIVGVSVIVKGTNHGGITQFDGQFLIKNVEPGTYRVKAAHIDYQPAEITDVNVSADQVIELNFVLKPRQLQFDLDSAGNVTIKVLSKKDIIDKFEVANQVALSKEVIAHVPIGDPLGGLGRPSSERQAGFPPAHGGTAIVNNQAFDAMFFKHYGVNPFVDTEDDHLSTFAIDVDDASYVMTRSYLDRGHLPPDEAVRTEEFINHFDYGYNAPSDERFSIFIDGAPSRFGNKCQLVRIGIKGRVIKPENRKPANLVFVIDVSGSMARENRLGLVKKALRLLVDELTVTDKVGIVVYGSTGRVILEPTSIANKDRIVSAIESLQTGGATNAEQGIMLGYQMAQKAFESGKINRVILCSDGVANVGRTGADQLLKQIKEFADKGITLTSVGFGMGNYNDIFLEKLGNKGNGHYAYVGNLPEARRVFVDNLTGTLEVIARDVKIQVDFNEDVVRSYRLLGYENRDVDDDKFRDDKEDGGEIGSGHAVTALYEVKLKDERASANLGTVFIRYKHPDTQEVTEVSRAIKTGALADEFENTAPEFQLAACTAEFAEILRKSYWAKDSKLGDVLAVVNGIYSSNERADVLELMGLISKAEQFEKQLAEN
jgi:Ca-activated chloride channel family protein